jgi:hypothetical protein
MHAAAAAPGTVGEGQIRGVATVKQDLLFAGLESSRPDAAVTPTEAQFSKRPGPVGVAVMVIAPRTAFVAIDPPPL